MRSVTVRRSSSYPWVGATLLSLLGAGCIIEDRPRPYRQDYVVVPSGPAPQAACLAPSGVAEQATIDTDAGIERDPAQPPGVGVFIEYLSGGHWHVTTVCDTAQSGQGCHFDIDGQVLGGTAANVVGDGLESSDFAALRCIDTATLSADTFSDADAVWFDAPAGSTVRFTILLGGAQTNFVFWISSGGATMLSSPGPVDLTPTAP